MSTCICIYMSICMCAFLHTYSYICVYTCMYVRVYMCMYMYMHLYLYTCMYIYTYMQTYMYIDVSNRYMRIHLYVEGDPFFSPLFRDRDSGDPAPKEQGAEHGLLPQGPRAPAPRLFVAFVPFPKGSISCPLKDSGSKDYTRFGFGTRVLKWAVYGPVGFGACLLLLLRSFVGVLLLRVLFCVFYLLVCVACMLCLVLF